jgi:hypothetical protein
MYNIKRARSMENACNNAVNSEPSHYFHAL